MQLETDLGKWALDEACLALGRRYENMLNEGKNPFGGGTAGGGRAQGYAPMPRREDIKTIQIPENGIW